MKLKVKGKPYIYTHECDSSDQGRPLSRAEMQEFVTDCLIKSYEMRGYECIRHTPDFNSDADFSYNKLGKTVCGVVKYGLSKDEVVKLINIMINEQQFQKKFPQLYKGFYEYNSYSVFYFATAKCLDTDDGSPIAGGRYEIEWDPVQALYHDIPTSGPNISEFEMYKGYAHSWETGDVSFIRDYVSRHFSGVSELSFECTTSKAELIELIKTQHENWKTRQITIRADLIKDKDSGDKGILMVLNGRPTGFVVLRFSNYRISQSETRVPPQNYEDWETGYDLYQTHGDHHAPFVNDDELPSFLKEVMEKSSVHLSLDTTISFDDVEALTRVASLRYPADKFSPDIAYLALIAYNPAEEVNEFITCYPYLKGKPTEVEVIDVLKWSNQIEATIKCKYCPDDEDDNEFVFHFFATDYYFNKNRYKIGEKLSIALAASSGNAKEASRGFTFEGQKAIDFLAKIGKEPTYDENGEVEPVKFSTEQLVAFLPHDEKCPDMAEFQSPLHNLTSKDFHHNRLNQCEIVIHQDTKLCVPLYFNDGFEPKEGDPIMGWLWLSGRIAGPIPEQISPHSIRESFEMSKTAHKFIEELSELKWRSIVDITPAFRILEDLSIPECCGAFAVRIGNEMYNKYELFIADFSEMTTVQSMLNSHGYIEMPSDSFTDFVTKSKTKIKGIGKHSAWQYFLFSLAVMYIPHRGYYSPSLGYILSNEDAKRASLVLNRKFNSVLLMPSIFIEYHFAGYFSVMAWNKGELIRRVFVYAVNDGHITFHLDGSYKVEEMIDYDSDDSHILFRDGDNAR